MDLLALLQGLAAQLADASAAAQALAEAKYQEGFVAGVASVPVILPSDKIYSQAELDAKLQEALQPIQAELDAVKAQFMDLQVQVDQKIADAIVAFKADILVKFKAEELVIEDLLK